SGSRSASPTGRGSRSRSTARRPTWNPITVVSSQPPTDQPALRAGPGYRTVAWNGTTIDLAMKQAAAVEVLIKAREAGMPDVPDAQTLQAAESESRSLMMLFRDHLGRFAFGPPAAAAAGVRLVLPDHGPGRQEFGNVRSRPVVGSPSGSCRR